MRNTINDVIECIYALAQRVTGIALKLCDNRHILCKREVGEHGEHWK